MGSAVAHHKHLSRVDGGSSTPEQTQSSNQTPVKERPTSQKQRRKTFSSLGIRGSFDFRG
ncbi:UNVERIFIED_CONTAM: hypothetical protein PYX00_009429 [Menopon gallinae]|uniref:Uncharacterized protein n=1 Tax=Menopon gallinae TaxID=328185 RepID=A0AAW2HBB5_9NEOP